MNKYLRDSTFIIFGYMPRVELLDHLVVLSLMLWGIAKLFFTAAASFYIFTNSAQGFYFLQIVISICY